MKNMGKFEQKARMVLGALLALAALKIDNNLSWLFLSSAVILIITAQYRFCPIWRIFGINTAPRNGR